MISAFRTAVLFAWLATPLFAAPSVQECMSAKRLVMLGDAYTALLRAPDDPQSAKIAFYVSVLVDTASSEAPSNLQPSLALLSALADTVQARGTHAEISHATLSRHIEAARRLRASPVPAGCPDARPSSASTDDPRRPEPHRDQVGNGHETAARATGASGERVWNKITSLSIEDIDWKEAVTEVLTPRTLLILFVTATLFTIGWCVPVIATALKKRQGSIEKTPARRDILGKLLNRLARNQRRAPHHVLGRFFDISRDGFVTRQRIKVADIGIYGAKLAWSDPPAIGTTLDLDLDRLRKRAEVIWVNAHFCGVEFDDPVSEADLKRILARPEEDTAASGELEMF